LVAELGLLAGGSGTLPRQRAGRPRYSRPREEFTSPNGGVKLPPHHRGFLETKGG